MENENTPAEVEETKVELPAEGTEELAETTETTPEAIGTVEEEPTLILGKYKTVEELEKSYLGIQKEYTRVTQAQKDPEYVYNLAKQAGLTNEEAQAEVDKSVDINQIVDQRLQVAKDYDAALTILPELGKDAKLEAWGRALVDMGMTHIEAAKTIKSELGKASETARVEGAKSKEVEISDKEAAQTSPTIGNVDSEAQEIETLRQQSKSLNRQEQDSALEQLIYKNL